MHPTFETLLAPAAKVGDSETPDSPIPYHMVTGMRLKEDISTGAALTVGMVQNLTESPLWHLRTERDAVTAQTWSGNPNDLPTNRNS